MARTTVLEHARETEGLGRRAACGCGKIPPRGEDFYYVRVRGRGLVHVAVWHDEDCDREARSMAEVIAIQHVTLQCGKTVSRNLGREGDPGATQRVSDFRDSEFCGPCIRALRDEAYRAFARRQPDDCLACGAVRDECEHAVRRCCDECEHPDA